MRKILWISGFGIVFLILSIITSVYSLNQAKASIEAIGQVSLSDSSLDQIETATQNYANLSSGIGASILFSDAVDNYVDYEKLSNAQDDYITLKITEIAEATSILTEDDLIDQIVLIRDKITDFYPEEDYDGINNYLEFEALEQEYIPDTQTEAS